METNSFSTGFTPAGQLYIQIKTPAGTLVKTTKSPIKFMRDLFAIPEDPEIEQERVAATYTYDYTCRACEGGFDSGSGAKISDEPFCTPCLDAYNHIDFFRNLGLCDGFINFLDDNRKRYL